MNGVVNYNEYKAEVQKLNKRIRIMREALVYCSNYAHPSIVGDVAKKALKDAKNIKKWSL